MPDEFLTVNEIADLLKLNQQTVRNWIDRGDLVAVRVGARRVRVRQSGLDAFLAESTTGLGSAHDAPDEKLVQSVQEAVLATRQ